MASPPPAMILSPETALEQHRERLLSVIYLRMVTLARRKVARIVRDQIGVAARDPRREHAMKTDLPLPDRRTGPVTAADRKDRLLLLEQALERLSDDYREVIMLTKIEGLSAREVGVRMDRSENAVNLLLSRALKRLAQELKL
jgi:RNA polymerase sigma factor (sigma-70 family)